MKKHLFFAIAIAVLVLFASCTSTKALSNENAEYWTLTEEQESLYYQIDEDLAGITGCEAFGEGIYEAEYNNVTFRRVFKEESGMGFSARQYLFNGYIAPSGNKYSGSINCYYNRESEDYIENFTTTDCIINDEIFYHFEMNAKSNGEYFYEGPCQGFLDGHAFAYSFN